MKKKFLFVVLMLMIISIMGCTGNNVEEAEITAEEKVDYSGTYIGYSWKGESKGVAFEDATQKIETMLKLDKDGTIIDAEMLFWKIKDGYWTPKQSGGATVEVDFSVEPTRTTPGENYAKGNSMFSIKTIELLGFYAAAVDADGTAAIAILEPTTRHQFEMKLKPGYDYSTKIGELTINSGQLVPTVRASSHGIVHVDDWADLYDKDIFNMNPFAGVMTARGTFEGLDSTSTVQELLESMGVVFVDSKPQPVAEIHGFHSNGGWAGNYKAIKENLIGKNALEMTSLVDWSVERWINGVNEDNFFGVDDVTGATKTVQNSVDTISGATIRMSRESASYQRALVEAGILEESDVIKGRF